MRFTSWAEWLRGGRRQEGNFLFFSRTALFKVVSNLYCSARRETAHIRVPELSRHWCVPLSTRMAQDSLHQEFKDLNWMLLYAEQRTWALNYIRNPLELSRYLRGAGPARSVCAPSSLSLWAQEEEWGRRTRPGWLSPTLPFPGWTLTGNLWCMTASCGKAELKMTGYWFLCSSPQGLSYLDITKIASPVRIQKYGQHLETLCILNCSLAL